MHVFVSTRGGIRPKYLCAWINFQTLLIVSQFNSTSFLTCQALMNDLMGDL